MSTSVPLIDALFGDAAVLPRPLKRVLIAVDGSSESDAALVFTHALAQTEPIDIRVVSAVEPVGPIASTSALGPGLIQATDASDITDAATAREFRVRGVLSQVSAATGGEAHWPVSVVTGSMGPIVAAEAMDATSDLIVAGRGRHGVVDRLLGEEHFLKMLRLVSCPVLSVDPGLTSRPRRAAIGIDLGPRTADIIRAGLTLLDEQATLYLVHVVPDAPFGVDEPEEWLREYETAVHGSLNRMRARLRVPAGTTVHTVVLNGDPGSALADLANAAKLDLIVAGTRGHGFFTRLVAGSVTARVLRAAKCSLLSVPTASPSQGVPLHQSQTQSAR